MSDRITTPRAEDLLSVGSRISWGAILGGGLVACAIYFMFTTLGVAVGLSVGDRVDPINLQTSVVVWGILTFSIAVFVGGLMTSLYTTGENKTEAVFSSVIMWAFVVSLFMFLGAAGVSRAFNGAVGLVNAVQSPNAPSWEAAAREAGVPAETVEEWRRRAAAKATDPQTQTEVMNAAKRVAWYAFAGTWISMLAAAAGGWIGAGPTFRLVVVPGGRTAPGY